MSDLTPTEGARFLLEREREDDGGARAVYRAAIYTRELTYTGSAALADDGSVDVTIDAPPELRDMLATFGKLTARAAAKKRADGLPPWPARVMRWR